VGEQSQSDLAEALRVDRTNLVGLLNDLETADLIERRRSPQDRRRHTVSLTPAGTRRLAEVQNALAAAEQRVLSALDAEQQARRRLTLSVVELPGIEPAAKSPLNCGNTESDDAKQRQATPNDRRYSDCVDDINNG
jgi:DNA-binding HxlR family transcriptional regulator